MSEKIELKSGLYGWQRDGLDVWYVGTEQSDGPELLGFGDSLEDAEQNYWNNRVTHLETELVKHTKHHIISSGNLKHYKALWESQNKDIIELAQKAKEDVDQVEADLKAAAVRLYELTGDKKPSRFAEIKEKAGVLIYDTALAIEWCRENMKAAINEVLNTKAFESFSGAKDLEFVTETNPVPTAQIARKKLEESVGS